MGMNFTCLHIWFYLFDPEALVSPFKRAENALLEKDENVELTKRCVQMQFVFGSPIYFDILF